MSYHRLEVATSLEGSENKLRLQGPRRAAIAQLAAVLKLRIQVGAQLSCWWAGGRANVTRSVLHRPYWQPTTSWYAPSRRLSCWQLGVPSCAANGLQAVPHQAHWAAGSCVTTPRGVGPRPSVMGCQRLCPAGPQQQCLLCCWQRLQELNGSTSAQAPCVGLTGMQALKPFVAGLIVSDGELQHGRLQRSAVAAVAPTPASPAQLPMNRHKFGYTSTPCPAWVTCALPAQHVFSRSISAASAVGNDPRRVCSAAASRCGPGPQGSRRGCKQRPAAAALAAPQCPRAGGA